MQHSPVLLLEQFLLLARVSLCEHAKHFARHFSHHGIEAKGHRRDARERIHGTAVVRSFVLQLANEVEASLLSDVHCILRRAAAQKALQQRGCRVLRGEWIFRRRGGCVRPLVRVVTLARASRLGVVDGHRPALSMPALASVVRAARLENLADVLHLVHHLAVLPSCVSLHLADVLRRRDDGIPEQRVLHASLELEDTAVRVRLEHARVDRQRLRVGSRRVPGACNGRVHATSVVGVLAHNVAHDWLPHAQLAAPGSRGGSQVLYAAALKLDELMLPFTQPGDAQSLEPLRGDSLLLLLSALDGALEHRKAFVLQSTELALALRPLRRFPRLDELVSKRQVVEVVERRQACLEGALDPRLFDSLHLRESRGKSVSDVKVLKREQLRRTLVRVVLVGEVLLLRGHGVAAGHLVRRIPRNRLRLRLAVQRLRSRVQHASRRRLRRSCGGSRRLRHGAHSRHGG